MKFFEFHHRTLDCRRKLEYRNKQVLWQDLTTTMKDDRESCSTGSSMSGIYKNILNNKVSSFYSSAYRTIAQIHWHCELVQKIVFLQSFQESLDHVRSNYRKTLRDIQVIWLFHCLTELCKLIKWNWDLSERYFSNI